MRLEKRIAQLEGRAKPANSRRMPGLKPNAKADRKPAPPKGPRKPRPHGFARTRMTPTRRCGARDGELSRLRRTPVRRLDPAHSGSHRAAGGSGASHRARLHCSDLPGSDLPGSDLPGSDLPGSAARLGLARLGLARLGLARLGLARLGLARLGLARLGLARLGLARLGLARLGLARRADGAAHLRRNWTAWSWASSASASTCSA